MEFRELGLEDQQSLENMLGYLNFSSGARDNQFLININRIFAALEEKSASAKTPTWRRMIRLLREKLQVLKESATAFGDSSQAESVISLVADAVLPEYLRFHHDLLFHHSDATLFRPFFLGCVFEIVLGLGTDWDETERIRKTALLRLNDFVGFRPVPVLETRRVEPYPHERIRPIPLYLHEVGVSVGPYDAVVKQALNLLSTTDADILEAAYFNTKQLYELAYDPRAYDFDHPVNKRPNYHFGLWDPHSIDSKGFFNRFVIQQVTLDALMQRVIDSSSIPHSQRVIEASAVLAGTILMAAGVSGNGPETHDSETSLGTLLPRIAAYRDTFYERLIERLEPAHRDRLRKESRQLLQPFGAARQHLNAQLTRRRASQLEHVRMASVFARMGYADAAQRQIDTVPVASARMLCQLDCNLTSVKRKIESGELPDALRLLITSREVLHRGIQCGAIVDPWNILGFDGNFSLFPHLENSIHDHRVDQIVELIDEIFEIYTRLLSAAAAADKPDLRESISTNFRDLVDWWRQYAPHEVSAIQTPDPRDVYNAAESVADAMSQWHRGGEATGDVRFWAPFVERFDTPRAYQLVIEMLLDRRDFVASRSLLVHWLTQAERVPLEHGESSFHYMSLKWLSGLLELKNSAQDVSSRNINWFLIRKFFDYIEANAEEYWQVPTFEISLEPQDEDEFPDEEELLEEDQYAEQENLFEAAYDDVVYRDSTDDGMDSSLYDTGSSGDDQLDDIHDRIVGRLMFLNGISRLRTIAAIIWMQNRPADSNDVDVIFRSWWAHIEQCQEQLSVLLGQVERYKLSRPSGDLLSMHEFDRQRMIRESLLEHIIGCTIEITESALFVLMVMPESPERSQIVTRLSDEDRGMIELLGDIVSRDVDRVELRMGVVLNLIRQKPILYVPLARGGNPKAIIQVRSRQHLIRVLLGWLPRLGLLTQTRNLIDTARQMEKATPSGPGAVTEFDDLFEVGYRALVESIIRASDVDESTHLVPTNRRDNADHDLVSCLESVTESMLVAWLSHSRTLRLSVMEKLKGRETWDELVGFIQRYGNELFTQQFLSLANVRAVLYQGVDVWLERLARQSDGETELKLLGELGDQISRDDAVRLLTLTLEAVAENYSEYRDYNSTTTQSDRGDLLFNLLDFLRLLSNYERVVWNLKPVVLSHELLVRHGCNSAAQMWRRALAERISEEADRYLKKLTKLQKQYAMRLPTVADRLNERFLRPMIIDRMKALIEPAMKRTSANAFEILEGEAELLMREPSGVGFDPPQWLGALEEEVLRIRAGASDLDDSTIIESLIEPIDLEIDEIQSQVDDWESGDSNLV